MTLDEKILKQLSAVYPDRQFSVTVDVDPVTFKGRTVLVINGIKSAYGFYPHHVEEICKYPTQKTEDQWVAEFVKNMVNTLEKDFNRR